MIFYEFISNFTNKLVKQSLRVTVFSDFFSKTVTFTKFLPKMCESNFHTLGWSAKDELRKDLVNSNMYSHSQWLFYEFVSKITNKLVKQSLRVTVDLISIALKKDWRLSDQLKTLFASKNLPAICQLKAKHCKCSVHIEI